MDSTISVSKGCFVFKKKKKVHAPSSAQLSRSPWYQSYKRCLADTEVLLKNREEKIFSDILGGLVDYVNKCSACPNPSVNEIPAATLLTGVNMPDHSSMFATLSAKISRDASPHVATLWARDCSSLKAAVERMCSQFVLDAPNEDEDIDVDDDYLSDEDTKKVTDTKKKIQRWQCNLQYLSSWYANLGNEVPSPSKKRKTSRAAINEQGYSKPLVVIIPDFESFSPKVLQEFVLLLSGHQKETPFVLVLGVATAVSAVHRSLPQHVSSCLRMKVFHSQPCNTYLNEILEKVLLSPDRIFHLGAKPYKLLLDVFLFHDFSVTGFIQGYKYCMMQHFYDSNWTVLTCPRSEIENTSKQLSKKDIECLQKLPSLRKYIQSLESRADQVSWLKDDNFVKKEVARLLSDLHIYIQAFYATLQSLNILTSSLPGAPLEKQLRSVYEVALSTDVYKSTQFKDCMKLLSFLSSEELESKLNEILPLLQVVAKNGCTQMLEVTKKLEKLVSKFKTLWQPIPMSPSKNLRSPSRSPMKGVKSPLQSPSKSPSKLLMNISNRSQLREKLKEISSSQEKKLSPYEQLRSEVLTFLSEELFAKYLPSPQTKPLHEIIFFDDINAVKPRIVGSPRQAVLRALKDPHYYLDCDCCKLSDINDILPTLPDVSIVYKLHLESGKLINMYDWLQSFLTIVNPCDEEQTEVDPKLQARFTRAVAELQFLGFIKSSNRKTDHVTRITWC